MITYATPLPSAPTLLDRVRVLDSRRALQQVSGLDIVPDGRIDLQDATALEQIAQRIDIPAPARTAEISYDAMAAALPLKDSNLFSELSLTRDGSMFASAPAHASQVATQLRWAAQQARIASAAGTAALVGADTVHDVLASTAPAFQKLAGPDAAVKAISALDVGSLKAAGVRPVAAFDIDGTSMKGDLFLGLVRSMANRKLFGESTNAEWKPILQKAGVDPAEFESRDANANAALAADRAGASFAMFFGTARALKGFRVADLEAIGRDLLEHGDGSPGAQPYRLNENADRATGSSVSSVVSALKAKGIEPWAVSFGYDWLTRIAAPYLGFDVDHVIGTHIPVRDGVFTGETPADVPKSVMLTHGVGTLPVIAFGNSKSDAPLFDASLVRGIVVNPTAAIREYATTRGNDLGEINYPDTLASIATTTPAQLPR